MSVQKSDHPSVKVAIVGTEGTGKTTLFMSLIARVRADYVFIYDHKDGDMARRWNVKACATADELYEAIGAGKRTVIFNPHEMYPGDSEAGFDFFCKLVWEVGRELVGVKLFITDEIDSVCNERCKPYALCRILSQGRTYQFDCYFMGTAMNGIHNQVRKSITEIFAFRQGDANGIEWLAKKGFNGNQLESLPNGVWHYKNLNTGFAKQGGKAFRPKGAERDLRGL
jgi:hypothetical protein